MPNLAPQSIQPDDIELTDNAVFVWEIVWWYRSFLSLVLYCLYADNCIRGTTTFVIEMCKTSQELDVLLACFSLF
jgi:hypothetical protein